MEVERKIKNYEKSKLVQLARRDSRTLEDAAKRVPKRVEGALSDDKKHLEVSHIFFRGTESHHE